MNLCTPLELMPVVAQLATTPRQGDVRVHQHSRVSTTSVFAPGAPQKTGYADRAPGATQETACADQVSVAGQVGGPSYDNFGVVLFKGAEFRLARACAIVTDTSLAHECAAVDRTQVYPVNGQDVVTDEGNAVRRVHVSVVHKEPQFHEEA